MRENFELEDYLENLKKLEEEEKKTTLLTDKRRLAAQIEATKNIIAYNNQLSLTRDQKEKRLLEDLIYQNNDLIKMYQKEQPRPLISKKVTLIVNMKKQLQQHQKIQRNLKKLRDAEYAIKDKTDFFEKQSKEMKKTQTFLGKTWENLKNLPSNLKKRATFGGKSSVEEISKKTAADTSSFSAIEDSLDEDETAKRRASAIFSQEFLSDEEAEAKELEELEKTLKEEEEIEILEEPTSARKLTVPFKSNIKEEKNFYTVSKNISADQSPSYQFYIPPEALKNKKDEHIEEVAIEAIHKSDLSAKKEITLSGKPDDIQTAISILRFLGYQHSIKVELKTLSGDTISRTFHSPTSEQRFALQGHTFIDIPFNKNPKKQLPYLEDEWFDKGAGVGRLAP